MLVYLSKKFKILLSWYGSPRTYTNKRSDWLVKTTKDDNTYCRNVVSKERIILITIVSGSQSQNVFILGWLVLLSTPTWQPRVTSDAFSYALDTSRG